MNKSAKRFAALQERASNAGFTLVVALIDRAQSEETPLGESMTLRGMQKLTENNVSLDTALGILEARVEQEENFQESFRGIVDLARAFTDAPYKGGCDNPNCCAQKGDTTDPAVESNCCAD